MRVHPDCPLQAGYFAISPVSSSSLCSILFFSSVSLSWQKMFYNMCNIIEPCTSSGLQTGFLIVLFFQAGFLLCAWSTDWYSTCIFGIFSLRYKVCFAFILLGLLLGCWVYKVYQQNSALHGWRCSFFQNFCWDISPFSAFYFCGIVWWCVAGPAPVVPVHHFQAHIRITWRCSVFFGLSHYVLRCGFLHTPTVTLGL